MASLAVRRRSLRPPRTIARVRITRRADKQAAIEFRSVQPGRIARDLQDLVAMGFIEKVWDKDRRVWCYQPLKGSCAS